MARRKKEAGATLVAVDGPLGSGKSAFAAAWAERFGARRARLELESNPFLGQVFEAPERLGFSAQMYFLLARHKMQDELRQAELFEPGVVIEGLFERDRVYADTFLDAEERALYGRIYDVLAPRAAVPDLVVWLRPRPDSSWARLRARCRGYERALEPEVVARLDRGFAGLFEAWDRSPVLEVRLGDIELEEQELALAEVVAEAHRARESMAIGERKVLELSAR